MSYVDEEVIEPSNDSVAQKLCILDKQIFASTAIIYVILITIMVLKGYKKILCITDIEEINRITTYNGGLVKYTILIILIVTFYYLYQSIENYQNTCANADKNYIIANALSVLATIIRFWTIYSTNISSNPDEIGSDIV